MFIVDANVLISYAEGRSEVTIKNWLDNKMAANQLHISAITRTEFLAKPGASKEALATGRQFLDRFISYPVTPQLADDAGEIRSRYGLALGDSIVSATALFFSFPVITSDLRGFHKIQGLLIIRPEEIPGL